MKKTLRYSLLMLVAILFGQAQAAEVTIDFNAMSVPTSSGSGENYVADGDINETWTLTQDGVTISVSPKNEDVTNPNRFWNTNNGPQLRCYSGTITISATETITKIEFGKNGSNFNLTPSVGTLEETTWTGSATEVVFTVNKNTQLNSITVTTGEGGTPQPAENQVMLYWTEGMESANAVTFDGGYKIAITGNESKKISNGNAITINGAEYTTMKVSNGAQNTLYMPEGKTATKLTFYSYVNKAEPTDRTPYWKEVDGVSYDETTSGGPMTSFQNYAEPDVRSFTLAAPKSTVTFTNTGEQLCYVLVIDVQDGGETPQPATVDIAGFKALEKGAEATLKLENAQVLYAAGNDIFVRDASGAIDFYKTGLNYDNNQILNGTVVGKYDIYNNMPEVVKGDNFAADLTATDGAMAQPVEVTIAQADMNRACDLILIKGLTLRQDGNNWYGDADGASIQVYDKFRLGYTPEEGKTYDITGILVPYKENFEICPIVDFTSGQQPEPQTGDILNESFMESLGNFTVNDGNLPEGLEHVWTQDSRYGAKASAFANEVKYATEAWLISPELDLTNHSSVKLSFEQTGKFFGNMEQEATIWVKELNGGSDWTKVTIPNYMTGTDWTYVETVVDLSAFDGKKIQFAFVYTSSSDYAATWEVKNVKVTGDVLTAINAVNADKQQAVRHNLAGQRVSNSYKGVVIENGKKFMVK